MSNAFWNALQQMGVSGEISLESLVQRLDLKGKRVSGMPSRELVDHLKQAGLLKVTRKDFKDVERLRKCILDNHQKGKEDVII